MFRYKATGEPGQQLTAAMFNHTNDAANKVERPGMGTRPGFDSALLKSEYAPPVTALALVRMTRDAIQEDLPEYSEVEGELDYGEMNAAIQVWDEEEGVWADLEDGNIFVTPAYGLPLLEGDRVTVWFKADAGRWIPLAQRETAMIRILSNVPNEDGYLDGIMQEYDVEFGEWFDTFPVWVLDANADQGIVATAESVFEEPIGAVDGTNATFVLLHAPNPLGSCEFFVDGLLQRQGLHYTLSGSILTTDVPPVVGSILQARYTYSL